MVLFSIGPVFGQYVWRALLVHIVDASLSAWFPPRRHGKILSKRKQPFLYTRRYLCNIWSNSFVSSFQHTMVRVFLQLKIQQYFSHSNSVWCYFYTSPMLQNYKLSANRNIVFVANISEWKINHDCIASFQQFLSVVFQLLNVSW